MRLRNGRLGGRRLGDRVRHVWGLCDSGNGSAWNGTTWVIHHYHPGLNYRCSDDQKQQFGAHDDCGAGDYALWYHCTYLLSDGVGCPCRVDEVKH